uniref:C-type lectin domain-containing protein n=1 Tax=Periophthalmus magnuspinnatus TaxID=409849 RepID=A0A3B4A4G1_9GOBI
MGFLGIVSLPVLAFSPNTDPSSSAHFSPKGLFCLSVSGRAYRLIEDQLSWTEAQSYCRAQYLDLATVDDQEQLNLLINVTQRNPPLGHVWTGLYDDMDSWRWSLQKEGYYDGGLDQFRLWDVGQPDNRRNEFTCGVMLTNGKWKTGPWTSERPFVCYSGKNIECIRNTEREMKGFFNIIMKNVTGKVYNPGIRNRLCF